MFWFFRKQRKKQRQEREKKIKNSRTIQKVQTSDTAFLCNSIICEDFARKTLLELHDIIIAFKIKQYEVGLSLEEREQLVQAKQASELKRLK